VVTTAGDTYNVLFDKLTSEFEGNPEELSAVNDWINFNKDEQEDMNVFDAELADDNCYASFNLTK